MDHRKIYDSIIEKARNENRIRKSYSERKKENFVSQYYENHHIIPKCLGGSDKNENRVLLTAREHFVCHKLLTYIYKENRKIANAFQRMVFNKKHNKYHKTSRDYAYAIELYRSIPVSKETIEKCRLANKGRKDSEETRQRKRGHIPWNKGKHTRTGAKNPMFGKESPRKGKHLSVETIELVRKNTKLAMQRPEVKQKLKENLPDRHGEKNSFFGKHHTKETIEILKIKKRKYNIPLNIIQNIKDDIKLISFKELQFKYPQYKHTLLGRITGGEYDKGYYEAKSKRR